MVSFFFVTLNAVDEACRSGLASRKFGNPGGVGFLQCLNDLDVFEDGAEPTDKLVSQMSIDHQCRQL